LSTTALCFQKRLFYDWVGAVSEQEMLLPNSTNLCHGGMNITSAVEEIPHYIAFILSPFTISTFVFKKQKMNTTFPNLLPGLRGVLEAPTELNPSHKTIRSLYYRS
jgi:hypothetical protein